MTIEARFIIHRRDFTLDVDLVIPARGVTAIFGPSGCGKTTLLRAIAGLESFHDGFLRVGKMLWQEGEYFVPPHQRPLGYVFQEASLFAHLNVKQNLEYGVKRVPIPKRKVSIGKAIGLLGIESLLERRTDQLSGGERQRVSIARALAVNPEILLMDEPLAALDLARKQEIMPYLESLHDELDIPIIYVSHSPDEVARLADHLVLLEAGQVKASGKITEMLTQLDLPLAHGDEAAALIEADVAGHDDRFNLTYVDFPGGRFTVSRREFPIHHPVRLRVAARDVSLTLEHQSGTSILNIFPATVEQVTPEGKAQVMVRLTVGGVPMLSRITLKSATLLNLKQGTPVYVQVKSVALLS
ncbi:molybdenum ABC transporter ATP-binding protein [Candidatus Vondammii sp. HM_W22]|uniref:molybdenum ABC transporter ATP-binding protein n=1 Tax=Candidatus Vondammii sp. HM_W22 TaxID=2687299 RepID=UPI001F12A84E|nr:molybdenum ABC transporter ATP-binding protein [Candidatus Vondammii sp. HM_W22]